MKKALFAGATLVAFSGAASAQLSLYGLADVCYGRSLYSDLNNVKADLHSGGDNGSSECNSTTRVGIKGSTDVGSGVKANFKFETGGITSGGRVTYDEIDANNGGSGTDGPFFNRQAWVGLSGGFGEVRVGRQDSVPFQVMGDFDFNGMSNGVSAGTYSGVGVFNRGRQSRSFQYLTPDLGGLTAQVGIRPKGNSQDGDKTVFSIGGKYAAGPLLLGASYQSKSDSSLKDDFFSLAVSYDLGVVKVMAGYADGGDIDDILAPKGSGKGPSLGLVAPIAGFNIGAIVAKNTDDNAKITSYEIFLNKEIFKNTYGYVEAGHWKNTTIDVKASGYSVGLIYVF